MQDQLLYVLPEGGSPYGPITVARIFTDLKSGQISPTAKVAPPGAAGWTDVFAIAEFAAILEGQSGNHTEAASLERRIAALKSELESVEEAVNIQSFGFYKPRYDFPEASEYEFKLIEIRDDQKFLLKMGDATRCDTNWTVDGSAAQGRKMVAQN